MSILNSLVHVFVYHVLVLIIQNVQSQSISPHVAIANFLGRTETILTSQNTSFYEKRSMFLQRLLEDEVIKNIVLKESSEFRNFHKKVPKENPFPCKNFSVSGSGTSVNNLTPGDIKVIAAIGDSLTAGVGIDAKTIFGILWEEKGKVFVIGGTEHVLTLPNFLRVYNPGVKGFATKTTFMKGHIDGLDMAVSGATSQDIFSQVETLIELLKNSDTVDMNNDWKLINIFIGNNDICRSCEQKNKDSFTPQLFKERLMDALDKLKKEVPRAFVSLMTMFAVYEVHNLNKGLGCSLLHLYECPCVAFSSDIDKVIKTTDEFQSVITEVSNSDRYQNTDDFVVVAQPFFQETNIPYVDGEPDLSYFSPDCFHLNEKGHGEVALSLWNSLFEPVQTKKRDWYVGEEFECPSLTRPYLATLKNSA